MTSCGDIDVGDVRVEYVADYVLKTMRLRPERWNRMYATDENKQICSDFFDKTDQTRLVFSVNVSGVLAVSYSWPVAQKVKCVYFMKKGNETIGKDAGFKQRLVVGDIGISPIDQLSSFVQEILQPLLSSDNNNDKWPRVVADDVINHILELKSKTFVLSGQVKGLTLLPLPPGIEQLDDNLNGPPNSSEPNTSARENKKPTKPLPVNRKLLHNIEYVVIEWSKQIHEVLKKESAQALLEGLNPNPFVEIEFWESRAQNLGYIYQQLNETKVIKMAEILLSVDSAYHASFLQLISDVTKAYDESLDISLYLKPLRTVLEDLDQTDVAELQQRLQAIMRVVGLVWLNSVRYRSPARLVVLLQEICNIIIDKCRNYLDPIELFKGEPEETLEKLEQALKAISDFKTSFADTKKKKVPTATLR